MFYTLRAVGSQSPVHSGQSSVMYWLFGFKTRSTYTVWECTCRIQASLNLYDTYAQAVVDFLS